MQHPEDIVDCPVGLRNTSPASNLELYPLQYIRNQVNSIVKLRSDTESRLLHTSSNKVPAEGKLPSPEHNQCHNNQNATKDFLFSDN
ncbi:hypothetical protein STEG23_026923 [Scotinomys teguina]